MKLNLVRFASLSAFAACSTFTLFQPDVANSQQSPATSPSTEGLEQQNTINPIDSENPSTLRQNPATRRQDSNRNDSLTAPNSNFPARGTYTAPRNGTSPSVSSPSGTQDSMSPAMSGDGSTDSNVGGSRRTSPNTGGSGSGYTQEMRVNERTNSTSGTQDSMSPAMGSEGAGSNVGGSRRTSPNTGGSGSGANPNMSVDGNTNSNTDGSVNSNPGMNGTMNNSGGTSGNTSGSVQGLW